MAKLVPDSTTNRVVVRCVIALLQLYAPLCLAYSLWSLAAMQRPFLASGCAAYLQHPALLWGLCLPESLFYCFFLWYARAIQREAVHPPQRTRDERLALFNKVRSEIYNPVTFLAGWFRGAKVEEIGREELRRFMDWSFWEGRAQRRDGKGEEREKDVVGEDEREIEEYIQKIERMMPAPFPEGRGQAKSLRLTLDPIEIEARSLMWYGLIMLADTMALLLLMAKGFEYYRRTGWGLAAVFPPRPATFFTTKKSVVPEYSYFLRPHTSKTRLPVLYIHGIGIGLLPAVSFLDELDHALNDDRPEDDRVGILAIEILQISSRLTSAIPTSSAFLSQLTTTVNLHFSPSTRFVLAAHSYGSILSTHILRSPILSRRVSGTLLVDPVSLLLHMPDVAYNFTVRKPVRANEWLLWYFASKDPQIAHTLGRHFHWAESVLWRDQIDHLVENHGMRFTASLGADDLIVNTSAVRAYLTGQDVPDVTPLVEAASGELEMEAQPPLPSRRDMKCGQGQSWKGKGVEVLWWDGYDHASVFDKAADRRKLIDVVVEYCTGS